MGGVVADMDSSPDGLFCWTVSSDNSFTGDLVTEGEFSRAGTTCEASTALSVNSGNTFDVFVCAKLILQEF